MTRNMASLINDATNAGYLVSTDEYGCTTIKKRIKINQHRKTRVHGLGISVDGWAWSLDILERSPGVARGIRSYKDMRAVLGI